MRKKEFLRHFCSSSYFCPPSVCLKRITDLNINLFKLLIFHGMNKFGLEEFAESESAGKEEPEDGGT